MVKFIRNVVVQYEDLHPGQYVPIYRRHVHGSEAMAVVRCPACKNLTSTTKSSHSIDHEGVVSPAIQCPHEGCTWCENVTFEDWIPESKGRA